MSIGNSNNLIPQNKFDLEAIKKIEEIKFENIISILPELLEWTKDINWPVTTPIFEYLSHSDIRIIPILTEIIRGDDDEWIFSLVYGLFPKLKMEIQTILRKELLIYYKRHEIDEYGEHVIKYIDGTI
jgi:hypothetical protein